MAQVIIVSNRLPVSVKKDKGKLVFSSSVGGLATGLSSYVTKHKGNVWVGWPGIASDELSETDKQVITEKLKKKGYMAVFLSQKQIDNFYNGYSNSILWPQFHGLPLRNVNHTTEDKWWSTYQSVNESFSEIIGDLITPKSQVWVHDYQLLLLPQMLRRLNRSGLLGFFLHIPFPSTKNFYQLKYAEPLLRGMLGADLIGFHTTSYVQNFLNNIRRADLGDINEHQISLGERKVRVAVFPMGIDYQKFADSGKQKEVQLLTESYKAKYKKLKIIASVDRLDPSKGLVERLKSYRLFLRNNPRQIGKVIFIMVAAPSRSDIPEYQNLGKQLDKLAEEINKEFSTSTWKPLEYINNLIPFENVTALFQIADVGFITPLRDGMNLAAKEFVASNQGRGVLILSQTAGAADELKDALLVDPKNAESLVKALEKALSMRRRELKRRLKRMRRHLSTNTVQFWAKSFVDTLQQPLPGTPHITRTLNSRLETRMLKEYQVSSPRLLLLDYDGSLVPFKDDFASSKPPKSLISLLKKIAADRNNDIVVISGRNSHDLDKWFSDIPINLVAEHGAVIKKVGQQWRTLIKEDAGWKKLLLPTLEKYATLTPGAQVEIKPHSLVWHYRAASSFYSQKYVVILKRSLKPILKKYGLEILSGNKVLEIKNPKINKGEAAQFWLNKSYDFIMSIGDDATDEELFGVLPIHAHSIKVGHGLTKAQYRLRSYQEVISLLNKIS